MAGKAPLLLASVLFAVGAGGLVLSSAERASWGPFEPRNPQPPARVVIVDAGHPLVNPPSLAELANPPVEALEAAAPQLILAAPTRVPPTPQPTATPTPIPPLRVFGISADDGGVSAAAASETPPPVRIVNVASDDESAESETSSETETPTPDEGAATGTAVADAEASETPTPDATEATGE